jgi:hypothetical protein
MAAAASMGGDQASISFTRAREGPREGGMERGRRVGTDAAAAWAGAVRAGRSCAGKTRRRHGRLQARVGSVSQTTDH